MGTRQQLISTLSIQFDDESVHKISTEKYRPLEGSREILVMGDAINAPPEIHIIPEVLTVGPREEIFIQSLCVNPPWFLSACMPIAQAFLLPKDFHIKSSSPQVYWNEIVGTDKPIMGCTLWYKGERHVDSGMIDTGAGITIIDQLPWNWGLTSPEGAISGIRGATTSRRGHHNIMVKGPEGQFATA